MNVLNRCLGRASSSYVDFSKKDDDYFDRELGKLLLVLKKCTTETVWDKKTVDERAGKIFRRLLRTASANPEYYDNIVENDVVIELIRVKGLSFALQGAIKKQMEPVAMFRTSDQVARIFVRILVFI